MTKLIFNIYGEAFEVEIGDGQESLDIIARRALALCDKSYTSNHLVNPWEVRDERGSLLDARRPASDYSFRDSSKIYLTHPVGFGG